MAETAEHNLAGSGAAAGKRRALRYAAWPLALLAAEVLAALLAPPRPGDLSPGALVIAGVVLLAGTLPALIRPSVATSIVGCSSVALASVLWRAADLAGAPPSLGRIAAELDTTAGRLNLLNTALVAPLTLHLAAIFPWRGALRGRLLAGYYALIVGAALAAGALPLALRSWALVGLVLAAYAGFGLAAALLLRTIRAVQIASPRAAQQARLLLLVLVMAEAPFMFLPLAPLVRLFIPYEVILGAQIVLPLGLAYTMTRADLFGIDAALRRTLDYTLVSFGLLVVYFGTTALLAQLSRDLGGTWGLAGTVLSVIAAAAAFTPLHRITQRAIDRTFYPERLRFGAAIGAARAQLARVVRREEVSALLESELPRELGAAWARLVIRPSFEQPAEVPGAWSALLTVGGKTIGSYWLGPRSSGLRYASEEQEQLRGLVQQAALALAYAETFDALAQLNSELEEQVATRTRHVLAQQRELAALEERQRLARELHDSVKQTLFGLGIGLRTVRGRVRSDPDSAIALLEQQEQAAIQAQAELGDLLGHLRTPAASSADLAALLAQHAGRLGEQHGLDVALELPPTLVLPEPLPRELAQVAREALQNVLRHSGATAARLSLGVERGLLTLAVADGGRGFDPAAAAHAGYGLRSMRERVALLGGTLTVRATPGEGTTICAQLSLSEEARRASRSAS